MVITDIMTSCVKRTLYVIDIRWKEILLLHKVCLLLLDHDMPLIQQQPVKKSSKNHKANTSTAGRPKSKLSDEQTRLKLNAHRSEKYINNKEKVSNGNNNEEIRVVKKDI